MALFYQPQLSDNYHFLDKEESHHCLKVLRMKVGDKINVLDGRGGMFESVITSDNHKKCEFDIVNASFKPPDDFNIHIAIAPTKNQDRIEWFVEKAVEIGIHEITFVRCANAERKRINLERIVRKAVSALKQSGQAYLPKINDLVGMTDLINEVAASEKYIAFVDHSNPVSISSIALPKSSYCLLIGPEGDFNNPEMKEAMNHNFRKVSLGNSVLRTETAGIIGCHTFNLLNQEYAE